MLFKANQVITIAEAKRLLGDEALEMTDEEVKQLINDFDIMAQHAIKLVQNPKYTDSKTD